MQSNTGGDFQFFILDGDTSVTVSTMETKNVNVEISGLKNTGIDKFVVTKDGPSTRSYTTNELV